MGKKLDSSALSQKDKINLVSGVGMWHTDSCGGKIPSIHLSDGPHGLRAQSEDATRNNDSIPATCFPTASASACTWDPELIAKMAAGIAQEAIAQNVSVVLGPGINIKRSPLCGRNFEYYSEDPLLAGTLGAAFINAMQALGVGTSLKHFAGNSQETRRMTANSQIDERALREIYLAAFEQCVKQAQPATIMASYNRLNGIHACENRTLLTEILRDEWGFKGAVISDWGACSDLPASILAGTDLEMPQSIPEHKMALAKTLSDGSADSAEMMKALDRASGKILNLVSTYGAHNRSTETVEKARSLVQSGINYDTALEVARSSGVLLKNNGILPLSGGRRILIVGHLAEKMRFQGGGSSHITTVPRPNAIECLERINREENRGFQIDYRQGYHADSYRSDGTLEKEALEAAKNADIVLFFGGLTDLAEGEGFDRRTFDLPQNQLSLAEKLAATDRPMVFVSFSGSPYSIPFFDRLDAMLHMYLSGEAVGQATADLLFGKSVPCGRLSETWPLKLDDTPCAETFGRETDDVEYQESLYTGYRYYTTFGVPVRFPFGFGLSYTDFAYSGMTCIEAPADSSAFVNVSLTVENTGSLAADHVVQIYVDNPAASYRRPKRELRGFTKIRLDPGEKKQVTVPLTERAFSIFDEDQRRFTVISGEYTIVAAPHAAAADPVSSGAGLVSVSFTVSEDKGIVCTKKEDFSVNHQSFLRIYNRPLSSFDKVSRGSYSTKNSLAQLAKACLLGKIVLAVARKEAYRMFPDTPKDDPEVLMTIEGLTGGTLDAVMGQSGGALPFSLGNAVVQAANGHPVKALKSLLGKP